MKTAINIFPLVLQAGILGFALAFSVPTRNNDTPLETVSSNRRNFLAAILGSNALLTVPSLTGAAGDSTVVLRLESPQGKAGLALTDVQIGTPPRNVVAIQQIVTSTRANRRLQPGLVLRDYPNAQTVVDRIRNGPYPIELQFYNLDASNGELGEALTAQDALQVAQKASQDGSVSESLKAVSPSSPDSNNNAYVKRVIKQADNCNLRSRRDDVLEIQYSAHIDSLDGIIYDDSSFRGTGRPYQMVLGSGDMIPGVDQGLYNMCPGEIRVLEIPPALAYGPRGNKLFRIPPNARLVWQVELVSVSTQRELPGDDDEEL